MRGTVWKQQTINTLCGRLSVLAQEDYVCNSKLFILLLQSITHYVKKILTFTPPSKKALRHKIEENMPWNVNSVKKSKTDLSKSPSGNTRLKRFMFKCQPSNMWILTTMWSSVFLSYLESFSGCQMSRQPWFQGTQLCHSDSGNLRLVSLNMFGEGRWWRGQIKETHKLKYCPCIQHPGQSLDPCHLQGLHQAQQHKELYSMTLSKFHLVRQQWGLGLLYYLDLGVTQWDPLCSWSQITTPQYIWAHSKESRANVCQLSTDSNSPHCCWLT